MNFNAPHRIHLLRLLACSILLGTLGLFTACSGPALKPDTKYVFSTDEATIEQCLSVLEHRLEDVHSTKVSIEEINGKKRLVVETAAATGLEELEALMFSDSKLEFRMVDIQNEVLSQQVLVPGNTPDGFKVVKRSSMHHREGDYLKAWDLEDWRNHPVVAERFPLNLEDEAAFEASVASQAFAGKMQRAVREHHATAKSDLMLQRTTDPKSGEVLYEPYYVEVQPRMQGAVVKKAKLESYAGEMHILLHFTKEARQRFGELTTQLAPMGDLAPPPQRGHDIGGSLALVLDGTLLTAPRINEPILGGVAQIAGDFSLEEAVQITRLLNAGEYPALLKFERREKLP